MRWRTLLTGLLFILEAGCASSSIFPPIGDKFANPLMLAVNSTTARLYVVNSNNKVIYQTGSLQVYNIATPTAPTLVGTAQADSFSGQIYLDTVNQILFTPNRYNTNTLATQDQVLWMNINEASSSFLAVNSLTSGGNPFGIACCDPSGRALAAALSGEMDGITLGAAPSLAAFNMSVTANDGTVYTNPSLNQLTILGAQAFVTLSAGNVFVVNLNKLGTGTNPVDYVITGINSPRSLANDGALIYATDVETVNGATVPQLLIFDPYSLSAQTGNSTATNVAVSTLSPTTLTMGTGTASTDPEQLVVGTNLVFVSNTGDDSVTVVNRVAKTVNTTIAVGDQPFGLALYSPGAVDTHVYVANVQDNTISVIDIPTLAVTATYAGP